MSGDVFAFRHLRVRDIFRISSILMLVLAQLTSAIGFRVTTAGNLRFDTSRPYPCMDRPCGCRTYEECWAGDCCCFTLKEKVAWARERGIEPPASAVAKVESAAATSGPQKGRTEINPGSSCCRPQESKPGATVRADGIADTIAAAEKNGVISHSSPSRDVQRSSKWVLALFAQKCKGMDFTGFGIPVSVPPPPPFVPTFDPPAADQVFSPIESPTGRSAPPDSPPPRT
jgi:hypothetical protein